jgi:hypothetical protein
MVEMMNAHWRRNITRQYAILLGGEPRVCPRTSKIMYPDRVAAVTAAIAMAELDPAKMRPHQCDQVPSPYHWHLTTKATGERPPYPSRRVAMARFLLADPHGGVPRSALYRSHPPVTRTRREECRRVLSDWERRGFIRREGENEIVVLLDRQGLLEYLDEILAPHL